MGKKLKIKGAWGGRDRSLRARTEDDIIYIHKASRYNLDHYPKLRDEVRRAGEIDLDHWEFEADDREASRYFDLMQGFD